MKSPREIKDIAKKNLVEYWGLAVVALLMYSVLLGIGVNFAFSFSNGFKVSSNSSSSIIAVFLAPVTIGYLSVHYNIFKNDNPDFSDLFKGFRDDYFTKVIVLFVKQLFTVLWFFVFIIPGFIKAFSYSMTEYIIQDDYFKEDGINAITLSRKMMDGHKMELLGLLLSFFGWFILTALTAGVLWLYVGPYVTQATTVFYEEVKLKYCKQLGLQYNQDEIEGYYQSSQTDKKDDDLYYE